MVMTSSKKWGLVKGTVVWFWDGKAWKRGKILTINKYWGPWFGSTWPGIWIKPYNGRALRFMELGVPGVFDGSLAKPTEHPDEIKKKRELEWKRSKKY